MNGSPDGYELEWLQRSEGRMFAYRYTGDANVPDHRLCTPCWNTEKLTVVLHERPTSGGEEYRKIACPKCGWETTLKRG